MPDQVSIPIPTKPDLTALRRSFQAIKTAFNDITSNVQAITGGNEDNATSALLLSMLGPNWKETLGAASPFINDSEITYTFSATTISQTMAKSDVIKNTLVLTGTVTSNVYFYLYWDGTRGSKHYRIKNNISSSTSGLVVYIKTTTGSISLPIPSGITDINVRPDGTIQNLGYGIIAQGQNPSGFYAVFSCGLAICIRQYTQTGSAGTWAAVGVAMPIAFLSVLGGSVSGIVTSSWINSDPPVITGCVDPVASNARWYAAFYPGNISQNANLQLVAFGFVNPAAYGG